MTELRHGSNVAGLQTEAMLDVATDEWVVHTPDEGAIKASAQFVSCVQQTGRIQSSIYNMRLQHLASFGMSTCLLCTRFTMDP
jgi:hypothetical protein